MAAMRLCVLGAGNVNYSPAVIASLATYFGERPLEITFYDADEERLDLLDRLARLCFSIVKSTHSLVSTSDAREALQPADWMILQMDENCASKYMKGQPVAQGAGLVELALENLLEAGRWERAEVLNLLPRTVHVPLRCYRRAEGWLSELPPEEQFSMSFQVLRWIRGEEYVTELLAENERSPLKQWLDQPDVLPAVLQKS
jgi:hypothetical protein